MIRNATPSDAVAIKDIYNYYVHNTIVTFEEEPVTAAEMLSRITEMQLNHLWLVYEWQGVVVGYAYAGKWKARSAYKHSVEVSVYLAPDVTGKGIGKRLYTTLLAELKPLGIHAVIGGIALPNDASVRLHETLGFKKVAHFREVGRKFDKWVDVAYWELILDQ
jgi:phosphinothricin acetyltransferase